MGVAVGAWQKVAALAAAAPPPLVSSSRVPYSPEVPILKDFPVFNWKLLLAIGVPFSSSVQVPGPVMSPPISVMVKVPFASGVQEALMEMAGGLGA